MWNKIKRGLFTFNLTVLLVFNLFLLLIAVLAVTAVIGWLAVRLEWIDLTKMLKPQAVMIVVYVASLLLAISMVVMIQKVILRPVWQMVKAMQRLEQGDFTVRVTCKGWMRPLELREYVRAFNKAAEELSGTEILRKDFINNFSHEFKTPITSIGGFADLLLEDENMPAAERREYLSIIACESKRLAALADRVLALSRVEAQSILTDAAPFPLAEQLRQCALMVEQKWRHRKKVNVEAFIPESDACIYIGNEALLKEVWVNLLDNAVKFSPEGGEVKLKLYRDTQGVMITVTDQGPGIDESIRERIFERFYQGDASHKTEGNGLGLTMVKKIVDLHDGRITVVSALGKGSSFSVWLPEKAGNDHKNE